MDIIKDVTTVEKPSRRNARGDRIPDPCAVVIFGASGDLTRRKLMPALYKLEQNKLLPQGFSVIGISRSLQNQESFHEEMLKAVKTFSDGKVDISGWKGFAERLFSIASDADNPDGYKQLSDLLERLDRERGTGGNRLYYLAVAPQLYPVIVEHIGKSGLARSKSNQNWTRIIIEKPFGRDLESAHALNEIVSRHLVEEQVYRIDHYLGKETVQNILVFRFANSIFEPIWNHHYIDHVQITSAETMGIENRGAYYDTAGALRDMVQNHMLQLMCTTAMEPPVAFTAHAVRDEKAKVLEAVRPCKPEDACRFVRGQYTEGYVEGEFVQGYRKEKSVAPDSRTETYVALKMFVDNWRWAGVPFYLRTGKRLPKRVTEIAIQFKRTPHLVFARTPEDQVVPNLLILGIQPDESISIQFEAKVPGPYIHLRSVNMDFHYETSFATPSEEAYERLLLDALLGDATLFARGDWIELAWSILTPILEYWESDIRTPVPPHAAGSWGPSESDVFLALDNKKWRQP